MKQKVALIGLIANVLLAAGKLVVAVISGSAAVMAEAIHSGVDVLSSLISFAGVKLSSRPSDEKHPYGHHKFEAIGSVIVTLILLATGGVIIFEAYHSFLEPREANIGWLTLVVMGVSALINEVVARLKIFYGKKENSLILISDGIHSRVDVYSSLAVFVGLLLARYYLYADAILALMIGGYIIYESLGLAREAISSLLDESADDEVSEQIKNIAEKLQIKINDLKTQKRGAIVSSELNILLDKDMTVSKAEEVSDLLRKKLIKKIPSLEYVSIGIKSHDVETRFFRGVLGRGLSWRRDIGQQREDLDKDGRGPKGSCVCSSCGYEMAHERAKPCSQTVCPKCNSQMTRKNAETEIS